MVLKGAAALAWAADAVTHMRKYKCDTQALTLGAGFAHLPMAVAPCNGAAATGIQPCKHPIQSQRS